MALEEEKSRPERRWKIGIVGAGYMGEEYLKVLKGHSSFEVCGIHSLSAKSAHRLAAKYEISGTPDSIETLYRDYQPDAVIVAVPELSTKKVLDKVLAFPWTCLVEKPAGFNLAEAEEIAKKVRLAGHPTFVALNRRFYSSTAKVTSILSSESGPRVIDVFDQEDPQVALKTGTPPKVVENWMYANSIHIIDLARTFVRGQVKTVDTKRIELGLRETIVVSDVYYSSGDMMRYFGAWNVPGRWGIHINTAERRLSLQPLEDAYVQERFSRKPVAYSQSKEDKMFKPGLWSMVCELERQLSEGHSRLPTITDSLESMRLISRIYGKGSLV